MTQWYDLIAGIYDQFSKRSYKKPRKILVQKLDIKHGETILHIGCGTGLSFQFIKDKIGDEGLLIGIDVSQNMLAQAQKKVRKNNWQNVHLIHADACDLSPELLKEHISEDVIIDHVIGELSFSVMPAWQSVMEKAVNLLKHGGKLGVLDGHRPRKDWLNTALNLLPQSDISRPISEHLSKLTQDVYLETFGFTKIVFIAIGTKSSKHDLA